MKKTLVQLLKLFLFLLIFFVFSRLVFLIYNLPKLKSESFFETIKSFWYAIPLDTSAICYLIAIPFFLLLLQILTEKKFFRTTIKIYFVTLLLLLSVIYASENILYDEWNIKLNYKAILHLQRPSEVFQTASSAHILKFFLFFVIEFSLGIFIYLKFIHPKKFITSLITSLHRFLHSFVLLVAISPLLILGARGGIQPIAINQSFVYYSKNNLLNDATANSAWNLTHSWIENMKDLNENPYSFYDLSSARRTVDSLYAVEKDSTVYFLKNKRPNVVLIILESWSADVIQSLGGDSGIAPNFEQLARDGILFTNIYATGWTSDQGIPAVLSAFPTQPQTSIVTQPAKYQHLPCIVKKFQENNYKTSFYYGGQLIYGNIKSYLYYNKFDRILEEKDFPDDVSHGKLGVHDKYVLEKQRVDLNKESEPFFSVLFTLSSHPPYDMPIDKKISFSKIENDYLNSIHYSDKCLGEYFSKAKNEKWYDNMLFILIADHSHNTPKEWKYFSPPHFKIPMLFLGNVIKEEFHGTKINKLGSQADLIATLFSQLNFDSGDFHWSKNLMNPYCPEFSFYVYYDGFGWIRPNENFVWDNPTKSFFEKNCNEKILREGKSYMQILFQDYQDY